MAYESYCEKKRDAISSEVINLAEQIGIVGHQKLLGLNVGRVSSTTLNRKLRTMSNSILETSVCKTFCGITVDRNPTGKCAMTILDDDTPQKILSTIIKQS
jgi:hypothetical protein